MLQNDTSEENDNDGFIIPMSPVTPGPADSPTSPMSAGHRMSMNIRASTITECGGDRLITYLRFLSHYWNHFSTGGLGISTNCLELLYSINILEIRPCFGFWRDPGGDQRV